MPKNQTKPRIYVCGDPTVDQVLLHIPARGGSTKNIQESYPSYILWQEEGGVHIAKPILADLNFEVTMNPVDLQDGSTLKSLVSVRCLKENDGKKTFTSALRKEQLPLLARVDSFEGYFAASQESSAAGCFERNCVAEQEEPGEQPTNGHPYPFVFISDAAGATRENKELAEQLTDEVVGDASWVLHKMHHPLAQGSRLRRALSKCSQANRILVVSANDLRLSHVRLRGYLSWDAVAEDIHADLRDSGLLRSLVEEYTAVCILFDVEAAVLLQKNGKRINVEMFLDTVRAEGDLSQSIPGAIYGQMNLFSCALMRALADTGGKLGNGTETIRPALAAMRRYACGEIRIEALNNTKPPKRPPCALPATEDDPYLKSIGTSNLSFEPDGRSAEMLPLVEKMAGGDLMATARRIVEKGVDEIEKIPSAQIGKFRTIDREEIESFRSVQRLIDRYLANTGESKPLCIGVFGPPGSGKSFGIKQIAEGRQIPWREFNLSEASPDALPGYFHELRDIVLRGKTPLCFFDEFDSRGSKLVARFLAPMQDGEFRDGSRVHPIGRSILVFAGGTAKTARHFVRGKGLSGKPSKADIKKLKLPDFVSRLSGVIDVLGPNRQNRHRSKGKVTKDKAFVLRRAVLLRTMLERSLPQVLADGAGVAAVSPGLIRAFLETDKYNFGARSMEQILRLSALDVSQSNYGPADLPDASRLKLHLADPEGFLATALEPWPDN